MGQWIGDFEDLDEKIRTSQDELKAFKKAAEEAFFISVGVSDVAERMSKFDTVVRTTAKTIEEANKEFAENRKELERIGKAAEKAAEKLKKFKEEALTALGASAGKTGVAERFSKFGPGGRIGIELPNEALKRAGDQRAALRDEIVAMGQANEIIVLRIRGERELADQLETRFELAKKFPDLNETELKQLEAITNVNKRLNNILKEQEELQKVRKELAQDFAQSIGQAFEDAIINGEKLSDVLQALLEDIQRIILRVTVTKPLENFLTGVLTGEDFTGSKAGPGGTPFFGGILGEFFRGGSESKSPISKSKFDPLGGGFDLETAKAFGLRPDASGHFGSVVPATEAQRSQFGLGEGSSLVLKGLAHPTFSKTVQAEIARGFKIAKFGERFFSVPAVGEGLGRAGGVGTPGVGGGFSPAAAAVEKLGEVAATAAGETEGLTGKIVGLGVEKTLEKVTTTTLTSSLFEFQVAVRLATQALQAMAAGIGAGAGSGAASGGISGLSSILNFGGSFGGDAGMPFGGQPPPFVPGFGFVGARQHGGPTGPNSPVLVGEAGPEVFVPNRAGRIEPMPRGERPIVVHQTMNVRSEDEPGFRRSARSNLRLLGRSAKSSLRGV
jgi:hypothetical protein